MLSQGILPVARIRQICLASVLFCGVAAAQARSAPYLLRLDHSNFEGHSCALLQTSGRFHLEIDDGDDVKVFEGNIKSEDLTRIAADLNSAALIDISQSLIQEPLIGTRHDELQLTILAGFIFPKQRQPAAFQTLASATRPLARYVAPRAAPRTFRRRREKPLLARGDNCSEEERPGTARVADSKNNHARTVWRPRASTSDASAAGSFAIGFASVAAALFRDENRKRA
jgi:hypothetical protein